MYRDNTLIPTEAIRLAALGTLAMRPMRYGDLAREAWAFASGITGPSLDLLGTSIELLRFESLVEPVGGADAEDDAPLQITAAGHAALRNLLNANVRTPVDGVAQMILALKLRFLHLLRADEQRDQINRLIEMSETECARLAQLRQRHGGEPGFLAAWLDHEVARVNARLTWLRTLQPITID